MSIPFYDILTTCQSQIRQYVDLSGEVGNAGVPHDNVVVRPMPYVHDARQRLSLQIKPAVVLSPGRMVRMPTSAGTNLQADVFYTVIAQIVDSCDAPNSLEKMEVWLKWERNLRRHFHTANLRGAINSATDGIVWFVETPSADVLHDKMMQLFDDCLFVVPIVVRCREPHGTTGRT